MEAEGARKKLFLHERVEVRSLEDGLQGSWHAATIIDYGHLSRLVQYEHLFNEDCSSLIERVDVSPAIDGCVNGANGVPYNHTGNIRPVPPACELDPCSLYYADFVDCFYEDAWWEGVIFDKKDRSLHRRIFFPDLGDEMEAHIDNLRLSKDWDEVSEEWKPRGYWVFLQLIEECEKECPLPVSVKQIWYEVRMKRGFEELSGWTSSCCDIWKDLVLQVLSDNFSIILNPLLTELNLPQNNGKLGQKMLTLFETAFDGVLKNIGASDKSDIPVPYMNTWEFSGLGNVPIQEDDQTCDLVQGQNSLIPIPTSVINEEGKCTPSLSVVTVAHNGDEDGRIGINDMSEDPSTSKSGYTDDCRSDRKAGVKWRSVVPKLIPGAEFFPEAIHELKESLRMNRRVPRILWLNIRKHLLYLGWKIEFMTDRFTRFRYFSPDGKLFYSLNQAFQVNNLECPIMESPSHALVSSVGEFSNITREKFQPTSELKLQSVDMLEPEYCPEAVKDYCCSKGLGDNGICTGSKLSNRERILKARKHLSAVGWTFHHYLKGRKQELLYISPEGRKFYSLLSACKWCTKAGKLRSNRPSSYKRFGNMKAVNNVDDCMPQKNASHQQQLGLVPKGNLPSLSGEFDNLPCESSCLSFPSQHIRGGIFKDNMPKKRATHKEVHPVQKSTISKRKLKLHVKEIRRNKNNDCMCGICHSGGDLLLCDQCPSAFHTGCLGLEEVPDGDWYCPPCCCRICNQNARGRRTGETTDASDLICSQCECRYHAECFRKTSTANWSRHAGKFFCQDTCEKIYYGLQKVLGKPFHVAAGNLTWTLLKCSESNSYDHDASGDNCLMKSSRKLKRALSVMHERFEPIKEPRSKKDLAKFVIFNQRSEALYLNYEGFYTVLLERNNDLISVANVRIYGRKVAEVPFVATRFRYQRLGMCRVLMNQLEQILMDLGVERLVLPAASNVLNTWTNSFGFSVMTEVERLMFLEYTFLNFHGTVLCQKLLSTNCSTPSSHLTGENIARNSDECSKTPDSQVGEGDTMEKNKTVEEDGLVTSSTQPVAFLEDQDQDQSTTTKCSSFPMPECPFELKPENKRNFVGGFKCYKRRRVSAR